MIPGRGALYLSCATILWNGAPSRRSGRYRDGSGRLPAQSRGGGWWAAGRELNGPRGPRCGASGLTGHRHGRWWEWMPRTSASDCRCGSSLPRA
eukprot:scaffold8188_cov149-Isochrysis_galbana.AAC.1